MEPALSGQYHPPRVICVKTSATWLVLLLVLCAIPALSAADVPVSIDATLGLYVGDGAHPACTDAARRMFESMGVRIVEITAASFNNDDVDGIDVFYFAGGESGPYIDDITPGGKALLRRRVVEGAAYIGTCAGSMFAAAVQVWEGYTMTRGQLGVFSGDAVGPAPDICGPNGGVCTCWIDVNTEHPIGRGIPESIEISYYNSPFFRFLDGSSVEIVATYQATGEPTIIAAPYGSGRVVLTGVHPEWMPGPPWDLMTNAVLWCLGRLETAD